MSNVDTIEYAKPILVCYHESCMDGFTAATIARRKFKDDADYMSVQYGKEYDLDLFKDKDVYILDFSFPLDKCNAINNAAKSLLIIDHHKTAQEALSGCDYAIFDMTKSGALLTWEYFFPHEPTTLMVEYISAYDLWNHHTPDIKYLHKGLNNHPFDFDIYSPLVEDGSYSNILPYIEEGKIIEEFTAQQVSRMMKHAAECNINGEIGLIANASSIFISDLGHEMAKQCGTYGAVFTITKDFELLVSLRSVGEYDVSSLAKQFGGGGHKNSSAFKTSLENFSHWGTFLISNTSVVPLEFDAFVCSDLIVRTRALTNVIAMDTKIIGEVNALYMAAYQKYLNGLTTPQTIDICDLPSYKFLAKHILH